MKIPLILCLSCLALPCLSGELKVGQKAPDFKLPTIFGDSTYASKDLFPKNELTILILWASYCPDCWKALKNCRDLSARVKDMGVRVIGINFDTEKLATVRGFIKGEKIDFINLSDFQGKTIQAYGAESYDFSTFIVDKSGIVKHVSYDHPPDIDKVLLKRIQETLQKGDGEKSKKKTRDEKRDADRKV
jgi:peroxiredoxin